MVERLYGLPRQGPAAAVAHGYGYGQGQVQPHFVHGVDRRLHVERVEAGFEQYQVHPAFRKGADLLAVHLHEVVEIVFPVGRVQRIGGEGKRLPGRSHAPGHQYPALCFVGGFSGYACGLQGHFARLVLQPIFLLADAVCAEAIGLDYVGSRRNIGLMDSLNRFGVAKVESLEIGRAREACLKHSSHRAVEHQYAVWAV